MTGPSLAPLLSISFSSLASIRGRKGACNGKIEELYGQKLPPIQLVNHKCSRLSVDGHDPCPDMSVPDKNPVWAALDQFHNCIADKGYPIKEQKS
jgi:hypothetical protein